MAAEFGPTEVIDRSEPFDQLFRTITRLLRLGPRPATEPQTPISSDSALVDQLRHDPYWHLFETLINTNRSSWLKLLEGHCAEEIAKTSVVSISTIRSQIKSILQKLGVNTNRRRLPSHARAGWSLDAAKKRPKPANPRRNRAS